MASGVYAVGKASIVGGITAVLALVSFYLILRTKINPVWVILGSGGFGALLMTYLK
jgi:chromate transporter